MKKSETGSLNELTLSHTANSYEAVDLGGTRRRIFLTQSISSGADLNGVALPSTTTTYQYDAYNNATQIAETTSDGFGKTITNTYSNDTTNWLLGRLLTADATSQAPDVASQIPAEDTTPDPFDFTDVTDALRDTVYEGRAALTGINRAKLTVTVSGADAQIRKNNDGEWISSLELNPGDMLNIRMTSGSAYHTAETVTATVTAGGVSSDWSITTAPPPPYASAIFNGTNEYLERTLATSNPIVTKYTYSMWVKLAGLTNTPRLWIIIGGEEDLQEYVKIYNNSNQESYIVKWESVILYEGEYGITGEFIYEEKIPEPSSINTWVHYVFAFDSTQVIEADRLRIYRNGILINPASNYGPPINLKSELFWNGRRHRLGDTSFAGRIAFVDIVQGLALEPSAFAFNKNGTWTRRPFEGSYGTYGFSLTGEGGLGVDRSGNRQHFTGTNMDATNLDPEDLPPFVF
jgi:hypothetical protein